MRALMWRGPGAIAVETVPDPALGPGEVVVRVTASSVCGSDLDGMLGEMANRTPPLVMGHELEGVVAATGPGVDRGLGGRRVTVNPIVACGTCAPCGRGQPQVCANRVVIGIGRPGGYAELVAAPARNVHPLPDPYPARAGAMVEPTANVLHAYGLAAASGTPDSLLVLGGGSLGQLLAQVALARGCRHVVVTDVVPERLATVAAAGATPVPATDDAALRAAAPGDGFAAVIDAVGSAAVRQQAIVHAARGGTVVLLGLRSDAWTVSAHEIIRRELRVLGTYAYTSTDFRAAIDLLGAGGLAWQGFAATCSLEEAPDRLGALVSAPGRASKLIIEPGSD